MKKNGLAKGKIVFTAVIMLLFFLGGGSCTLIAEGDKVLTFDEMMKFRQIEDAVISEDGKIIAFTARPDRGNPELVVCTEEGGCSLTRQLGSKPAISSDSRWVAAAREVDLVLSVKTKDEKPGPRRGMILLDLQSASWQEMEDVKDFAFSEDGNWLAYQKFPPVEPDEDGEDSGDETEKNKSDSSPLVLMDLSSGKEYVSEKVKDYSFDPESFFLAFSRSGSEDGKEGGIYVRNLDEKPGEEIAVYSLPEGDFSCLSWTEEGSWLAWVGGLEEADSYSVRIWEAGTPESRQVSGIPEGWYVPLQNEVEWTDDAARLFFGIKPAADKESAISEQEDSQDDNGDLDQGSREEKASEINEEDIKNTYDIDSLLERREMDVWHWNDPRIVTNQKSLWKEEKDRTYLATVLRSDPAKTVRLGGLDVPEVIPSQGEQFLMAHSQVPYMKLITWEGSFSDLYIVDLEDGSRTKVAEKIQREASISPSGEFIVYYKDRDWHFYDTGTGNTRNLTAGLEVSFADELHDYPSVVPGYGTPGWLEDSSAVFIYDRFDIWSFPSGDGEPVNMTEGKGREEQMTFRLIRTDPDEESWKKDEELLLSSYRDRSKNFGFYSLNSTNPGVSRLLEEEKMFSFLGQAKEADTLIYTREDYREFPDIWKSAGDFSSPVKISDVNPQVAEYAWGDAELVEWNSLDGIPLQGILIKPGNYEEGKRYPVIVYFYRFFSQRLHSFNTPVINHRPCFPMYASNGYAIFLPDIRFKVGSPGFAATKCLVPGVQKLIDMGIADPDAIGLHGHSWSGYQTAFIVTQTDLFAAAVAGAPVSNMTSAYGGIRWGTGLSRQFQYEKTQSRLGGSLWEYPERYIENSPLFFADRINTPLLIMFGDKDDAVPWYQGIELYMAMRRLEKDAIFLQYRGEPHHLKKYPNRLDYARRMKEYFDHYLKGMEAPEWITTGQPYRGK